MTETITAVMPTAPVIRSFLVVEDFDLTDPLGNIITTYMGGSRYGVREGNEKLLKLAEAWQEEGKVIIGG